jgi:hypothetical protein
MSDDQFTKLCKYMQAEFGAVRQEIGEIKQAVDSLADATAQYVKLGSI